MNTSTEYSADILERMQFLFIIGSPRSGTTWIQNMLASHEQVATTVELTLFNNYVAPWIKSWQREATNIEQGKWDQGLPYLWDEAEFTDYLREFLGKTYAKVEAKNPGATHILDKFPLYAVYTELIRQFLPEARFIHVIRDGRDVVVSILAARKNVGFGASNLVDAMATWKEMVTSAREARHYADSYLELRYEDTLANPVDTLKRVYAFCGLDASEAWIEEVTANHTFDKMKARRQTADAASKAAEGHYWRGKAGNWRDELSKLERYQVERGIGRELRELGYTQPGWWADNSLERVTIPLLYVASRILLRLKNAWYVLLGRKRVKK